MAEIIVALDVATLTEEEALLKKLRGIVTHYKIGLQLFAAHGKRAVDIVLRSGGRVFLDLKLFDIPQTVAHAVREAHRLGAFAVSLHLLGGSEMLKAAAQISPRPKLWGVTVLTSMGPNDLRALHPQASIQSTVLRLAKLAAAAKLNGIICSPKEVPLLQSKLNKNLDFITPGIRTSGAAAQDQKRLLAPAEAAAAGADYLVIGRPITRAPDPRRAAQEILREIHAS